MPHVFIILLLIMLFIVILSPMRSPADPTSGSWTAPPDSASLTRKPSTMWKMKTPSASWTTLKRYTTVLSTAPTIMGTLFICSGMIYLLEVSGAFGAAIHMILKKTKGREFSVVCIFYTIFVVFGVLGYTGEAAYPFYPLAGHHRLWPWDTTGWWEPPWRSSEVR